MNAVPCEMLDKIVTGDNVEVLRQFPAECIDLTVTSSPYDPVVQDENGRLITICKGMRDYEGYKWDFTTVANELYRVTKPGGVVVWVVADATIDGTETGSSFRQALYFMSLGFNTETMIYEQAGTGAKGSNYYYWQGFEYMFVFSKGNPAVSNRIADKKNLQDGKTAGYENKVSRLGTRNERGVRTIPAHSVRTNVWRYQVGNNGDEQTAHPAPFPESLARDHILSWSNPGMVVLDPFAGSGTTCKMAALLDRHFIGIEISERYARIARKRVEGVQLQPKLIPFEMTELNGR